MSTRRLADESVQPASFAFNNDNQAWAEKRIALYPAGRQQSAVIPLLMRAQDQDGWVTRATIEKVAEMLDMPYIRVLEVATFYTQFQLQPVGTNAHIQVCGTTPCMLRGAEGLIEVCKSKIHPEPHHLNADGTMSWEEVECLGACVNAPMVMIYHDVYEDLTPERMEEIVDAFAAGKGDTVNPGPQIDRQTSAAIGGRTTLLETPTAKREKFVPPPAPEAAPAAAAPVAAPAPAATTAAKPKDVAEENAPAIKGTPKAAKVSLAKAEAERISADVAAKADGTPNNAMREGATGAESRAEAVDGGKAVGKAKATPPAQGGASAGVEKTKPAIVAPAANPNEVVPTAEKGGELTPLFVRPEGPSDDLKLISGVGPVIERKLNALGITRYDQIAKFKKADIARVDAVLNFKGRIERDDWLKQAKALAKGGADEYRKVFGKDPR
ncbi:NADH-quinone oxidoreductase subunit NuoE [Devosia sp. XJ19-1]|uniref:NADH-quinone oxidoreductase subunit NuoE n=1 Tax=Devosia ureilytica TaxID=2952754 RepID=A0A9Q4FR38_9HYPH|nr:NADH-quinone oxidoreductase subunit NuoE [Devosia ureilytica]MCP8882312.1 NADH-quinone oxidoreductase subunit NuoE [Devosia ureilytica]MCP8885802.1 NADH-quinone oxidoreductase subunit NuoE [Devosia ureilytica]